MFLFAERRRLCRQETTFSAPGPPFFCVNRRSALAVQAPSRSSQNISNLSDTAMLRHLSAWAAIALLLVLPLQSAPAQSLDRPPATADTTRSVPPEAPPSADAPTAPAEDEAEQDGLFTEDVWDTGRAY